MAATWGRWGEAAHAAAVLFAHEGQHGEFLSPLAIYSFVKEAQLLTRELHEAGSTFYCPFIVFWWQLMRSLSQSL